MKKVIVALLILSTVSPFTASAEEFWYWVSVPANPKTGYFTEGPNTVGQTNNALVVRTTTSAGYPVITAVKTPLPDDFMKVMEMTEDSKGCAKELKNALSKLREFDSKNRIVNEIKSSVEINEKSLSGREKLLIKILDGAEQCLEADENKKEAREDEKRQIKIEEAIEECNFEFFEEEMSRRELMQTYKERMECKNGLAQATETEAGGDALLKKIQSLLELVIQLKAQLALMQLR